ncbi:MAG TPA: tRNA (N6-isopentenyl adenosine(37)-C2)-methylthiotransferase MiaB [Chitinophagaceae bacterium]|nr:tRNA (N6-isopentenyl adenosine(37)-C2)-methylthiotransferase MiaB [Chitinophagaceae bacterium]
MAITGLKVMNEQKQGTPYTSSMMPEKSNGDKFYIENYGCQMNFNDSEIVASLLTKEGYQVTGNYEDAKVVLINTCAIRDKAEMTIRRRLGTFNKIKKNNPGMLIGILGCMAERLKSKLLEEEKLVDIVAGPDAYRALPGLIDEADGGQKAINVFLSREETYADVSPVRLNSNGVTAFVSIMRGCNNMCTFCVVPFTRGRERSRDPQSIVRECVELRDNGYKEVTLLGQNVDSFNWVNPDTNEAVTFADLLEMVAKVSPELRVRFSTSHPKDITDDVLYTMAKYENICKYIHLPVQSGSTAVLQRMNRTYTREWYLNKVKRIREIMPDCAISTDIIAGFCGETLEEHEATLSVIEQVKYEMAYMFMYSERPGTLAARRFEDSVSEEEKKRRLQEIVDLQHKHQAELMPKDIGKTCKVLIEGNSKKSNQDWVGRNDQNKVVVFSKENRDLKPGDYAKVKVTDCTSATLLGKLA